MPKALRLGPALLASVALLSAIAPVATDMYLPAFPQVASDLTASATSIQLTLMSFMVGMALGQLVWGPISDRYGRYHPLLLAMALLVAAGAVAALSTQVWILVTARAVQGLAGSAGQVIGRALSRDLASGHRLARVYSLLAIVAGLAPAVAPLLGGALVGPIGWRGILWVIAGFSVVLLVVVRCAIPETLPPERRGGAGWRHVLDSAQTVVRDRLFLGSTLVQALGFGAVFAFISGSSFALQDQYRLSSALYSLVFAANAIAMMVGGVLNSWLVVRLGAETLLRWAVGGLTLSTATLAIVSATTSTPALAIALPLVMVGSMCGTPIMANTSVLALSRHHSSSAGMAAAILGAAQAAVAGAVSPLVSIGGTATVRSMSVVMVVCAIGAAVSHATLVHGRGATPAATLDEPAVPAPAP